MDFQFTKATKAQAFLRMALTGPPGAGKTYSALSIARHFPQPLALVDTEHGSASKYADLFDFSAVTLTDFHPENYVSCIRAAERAGFKTLIIDSLSHAWVGKGGALELKDKAGGTFASWMKVTPLQNALVDAILGARMHVIATMRSKMEYSQERVENKTQIVKLGMQPVQREGVEYEFDIVGDMQMPDNSMVISKTRCPALTGKTFHKPGRDVAETILAWLNEGHAVTAPSEDDLTAQLNEDIYRVAGEMSYSRDKVNKWVNGKYGEKFGVTEGLADPRLPKEARDEIYTTFNSQRTQHA